jgi:catechol-2,3-dioxygenase
MKRLHVHLSIDNLSESVEFYSTLFGTAPSLLKDDYAKWSLEDPRVNFAISKRARAAGLDHLGIQVDAAAELAEVAGRLTASGAKLLEQKGAACCYARSDKAWVTDPQGIAWETFHSLGEMTVYGEDGRATTESACCETVSCGTPAQAPAGKDSACCG